MRFCGFCGFLWLRDARGCVFVRGFAKHFITKPLFSSRNEGLTNVRCAMDDTESTTTSADENTGNLCDNPTRDTLAEGLLGLLKPTVDQLDDRVKATRISQLELKQQIDSLNEELLKVREALNNHPDLDPYVKKLIACKHKVTVVLNVLQASQDRLNEIRRMISKEKSVHPTVIITDPLPQEPEQGISGVISERGSIN